MESRVGIRKGAWTEHEDVLLKNYILQNGEGKWHQVPSKSGLNRCRKSCRIRWLNYLRPNIKRGEFSLDEVDLIMRLHKLLGNRWSLIAGRIPGRTANDVKNYWNTKLRKKMDSHHCKMKHQPPKHSIETKIIKPRPQTFSKTSLLKLREKFTSSFETQNNIITNDNHTNNESFQLQENQDITTTLSPFTVPNEEDQNELDEQQHQWWDNLIVENDGFGNIHQTCFFSLDWLNEDPIIGNHDEERVAVEGTRSDVEGKSTTGDFSNTSESSFGLDVCNLLNLENDLDY